MLYHIVDPSDWSDQYRPASLDGEGFVHLSTRDQLGATLDKFYAGHDSVVLLAVDPTVLDRRLRWEEVPGRNTPMPHYYGDLPADAVGEVSTVTRDSTGQWSDVDAGS